MMLPCPTREKITKLCLALPNLAPAVYGYRVPAALPEKGTGQAAAF